MVAKKIFTKISLLFVSSCHMFILLIVILQEKYDGVT